MDDAHCRLRSHDRLDAEDVQHTGWHQAVRTGEHPFQGECPCGFEGVSCTSQGYVEEIDLAFMGLQGTLPKSIGDFPYLKRLKLSSNDLRGKVPEEMSKLKRLETLELMSNPALEPLPVSVLGLPELNRAGAIFVDLPEGARRSSAELRNA